MQFGNRETSIDNGVKCWNLSCSFLERSGGSTLVETQCYTHAYLLKWRVSDKPGWRTLLRHGNDHCGLVKNGGRALGMYSNRNGAFRPCGFDITPQQDRFEVVVVTGEGDTVTSSTGTSTFYTEVEAGKMKPVGTADRVACGQKYWQLGHPGQGPGKIARVMTWQRVLSTSEIDAVARHLQSAWRVAYQRVWLRTILRARHLQEQQLNKIGLHEPETAAMQKFFRRFPGLRKLIGTICTSYCRPLTPQEREQQREVCRAPLTSTRPVVCGLTLIVGVITAPTHNLFTERQSRPALPRAGKWPYVPVHLAMSPSANCHLVHRRQWSIRSPSCRPSTRSLRTW